MESGSTELPNEIVETNVFIYAHDPTDAVKQSRAVELIEELVDKGVLTVTPQVLNEFYVRATRTSKPPALPHEAAAEIVRDLAASALVLPLTAAVTLRALDGAGRYGISFWDALLWAAARENGVRTIYTEDVPGAPKIEDVRYVNPFLR